eukprot:TRINITY_DN59483_c0_g2_i6.p1 TRINITY_DN59483_c0_g2~~TRINITY_DN59483_c0_g2_i6.p1  ORF type:complete len:122 (+),score=30.58 TRINITY_DN59483_c0_g2_i6:164-529(+)
MAAAKSRRPAAGSSAQPTAVVDTKLELSVTFPRAFSAEECADILKRIGPIHESALVNSERVSGSRRSTYRVAKAREVPLYELDKLDLRWVYDRIYDLATRANQKLWKHGDLKEADSLQFLS